MEIKPSILFGLLTFFISTYVDVTSAEQEPPGRQGDDDHRYILKYIDGSPEYLSRLENARRKLSDSSQTLKDFLPAENAEIIYLETEQEVEDWDNKEEIEYVIKDTKVYPHRISTPERINQANTIYPFAEKIPDSILQVNALDVDDSFVSNRKICIIDSGYEITHTDLPSGSTVTGSENGAGPWNQDGDGHGTHVAGTIAALGGNGRGVTGVIRNGEVKLHIVRIFNNEREFAWASTLVTAVDECVEAGANVINMSLGGLSFNALEWQAYQRFYDDGILIIASSGNKGDTIYQFPASYSGVMSVGAVDSQNVAPEFSNRNDQVEITAPGVSILSTYNGNRYAQMSGTSMSAPHVAGVAALVWSHYPTKNAIEVRQALINSALDLGDPGRDNIYGYGLVQADEALRFLGAACVDSPLGWNDGTDDCTWYATANFCRLYGSEYEGTEGMTANQACCVCGGGATSQDSKPPTPSPIAVTAPPTQTPTTPPTPVPTSSPTSTPTLNPTSPPTLSPTLSPTPTPTPVPTSAPTSAPTQLPTPVPTSAPTSAPTPLPTSSPTPSPTPVPTSSPTSPPTPIPSPLPTQAPTSAPTPLPTLVPTQSSTPVPTSTPTSALTSAPSPSPTQAPTSAPTPLPTSVPTSRPTSAPTSASTLLPKSVPTALPTQSPTPVPTSSTTTPAPTPSSTLEAPSKVPTRIVANSNPSPSASASSACSRPINIVASLGLVLFTSLL